MLSLFNIASFNWNALGQVFLQSSDSDIEESLFFVFQPAIYHALRIRIRMANTVGDWVVQSRHFGWQPWADVWSGALSWLQMTLFVYWTEIIHERTQSFWWQGRYLHDKWLARRPSTTILLQWNQSFGEMLEKVHFSSRSICWKITVRCAYR